MKILVVSQYFWAESFRINDPALGLKQRGHDIAVLTGKPNYPAGIFSPGYSFFSPGVEVFQGVQVYRVPLVPRGAGKRWRVALNYLSFAVFACPLAPIKCHGRFDLIFIYEPSPITVCLPAILLKKLRKVPIMLWVQDLWQESLSATGAVQSPRIRFSLLQQHGNQDVFGPDVLMNILIVVSTPFLYYLVGKQALMPLHLVSSLLAF